MSLTRFRRQAPDLYWPPPRSSGNLTEPVRVSAHDHRILTETDRTLEAYESPIGNSLKAYVYAKHFWRKDTSSSPFADEYLAVKSVIIRKSGPGEDFVQQVKDELKKLRSIRHPHIIAALGSFEESMYQEKLPRFCILLFPLARCHLGVYLNDLVYYRDRRDWTIDEVVEYTKKLVSWFSCLCTAVLYLHATLDDPIIHRDIKLENVLVDVDDEVILADLDISKQYAEYGPIHSDGASNGSRFYMPPAVKLGEPRGKDRDLCGLGIVFLFMATVLLGDTYTSLIDNMRADEVELAMFITSGRLDGWIIRLKQACDKSDRKWPRPTFEALNTEPGESYLEDFLDHIVNLLQANISTDDLNKPVRKRNIEVLVDAWTCFAKPCEPCEHCHDQNTGVVQRALSRIDRLHPQVQPTQQPTPLPCVTSAEQKELHKIENAVMKVPPDVATDVATQGLQANRRLPREKAPDDLSAPKDRPVVQDDVQSSGAPPEVVVTDTDPEQEPRMTLYPARPIPTGADALTVPHGYGPPSEPSDVDVRSTAGNTSAASSMEPMGPVVDCKAWVIVYEGSKCHARRRKYLRKRYCRKAINDGEDRWFGRFYALNKDDRDQTVVLKASSSGQHRLDAGFQMDQIIISPLKAWHHHALARGWWHRLEANYLFVPLEALNSVSGYPPPQ